MSVAVVRRVVGKAWLKADVPAAASRQYQPAKPRFKLPQPNDSKQITTQGFDEARLLVSSTQIKSLAAAYASSAASHTVQISLYSRSCWLVCHLLAFEISAEVTVDIFSRCSYVHGSFHHAAWEYIGDDFCGPRADALAQTLGLLPFSYSACPFTTKDMASSSAPNGDSAPEDLYFEANPPPSFLDSHMTLAKAFIDKHASSDRRVVLVTSGGTTVPLENQTVRFIDNFSNGTRGATSAEYFLDEGYAVIFLHRQFSLLPYSRHYSHSTNCFLDFMDISNLTGRVTVGEEYQAKMKQVLNQYRKSQTEGTLLLLPFTNITEYLWCLRETARFMKPLGSSGLFYLAAAVSDFFVPKDRMVEHKIQSSEEYNIPASSFEKEMLPAAHMEDKSLVIDLDPVPKFLKRLVDLWAPGAMIISFKLETDPNLLIKKASGALKKYSHHLVIGNLLSTRKWEVVFVSALESEKWVRVPPRLRHGSVSGKPELVGSAQDLTSENDSLPDSVPPSGEPIVEIESLMIPEVARLHTTFIENGQA